MAIRVMLISVNDNANKTNFRRSSSSMLLTPLLWLSSQCSQRVLPRPKKLKLFFCDYLSGKLEHTHNALVVVFASIRMNKTAYKKFLNLNTIECFFINGRYYRLVYAE